LSTDVKKTEYALRIEKLKKELLAQPDTIITGVLGLDTPTKGWSRDDNYWSLHFRLLAWKESGGKLNNSKLFVSKYLAEGGINDSKAKGLAEAQLGEIKAKVMKESLVQLKVKVVKNSVYGDARAMLIAILDPPVDEELQSVLDKLNIPIEIKHPVFGVFELNKSVDWLEGHIKWVGASVRVNVAQDKKGETESSFNTLESLYNDSDNWSKKITDYAVSQLLELKNDTWQEEGQGKVSASQFAETMTLESITVHPDGKFDFWHDDGGLFLGHAIQISGSLSKGPDFSDIPG